MHARAHQLSRFTRARARVARNARVPKGTNSQVSADDSRPLVRAVVAKPGRGMGEGEGGRGKEEEGFRFRAPFRGKIAAAVIKCTNHAYRRGRMSSGFFSLRSLARSLARAFGGLNETAVD